MMTTLIEPNTATQTNAASSLISLNQRPDVLSRVAAAVQPPALGSARDAAAPLDFAQLVRRCMGRTDLAERLLKSFHERFPTEVDQIRRCRVDNDLPRLARLVHQLKGTAANVSAPALHAITMAMENAAKAERYAEFDNCLSQLDDAWTEFQNFADRLPQTAAASALAPRRTPPTPVN